MPSSSSSTQRSPLAERRALITGAASGIGLATAQRFRAEGAQVVLTDVSDHVEEAARACGASAVRSDLTHVGAPEAVVERAVDVMGGLDAVVNCAGVHVGGRLSDLTKEAWDRSLAVNLTAPFALCRAALPHLGEGASIVNVASGVGLLPDSPGVSAYAASKGGLIAFTRALAAELAPNVRVNAVCPGLTRTHMTEFLLTEESHATQRYALGRAADPSEIAAAIMWLTAGDASFVTGAALAVDGGRTFH